MALDNAKNFSKVTVSTGYNAAATSIVLSAGQGAKLPTASFNAAWWDSTSYNDPSDDPNVEIVRVTVISTDTLTITRAQEGTSASTKNTAGKVYKMIAGLTAKVINTDLPPYTSLGTTQGSVFFAGAAGIHSENNPNFFWNNTPSAGQGPVFSLGVRQVFGAGTIDDPGVDANIVGTGTHFLTDFVVGSIFFDYIGQFYATILTITDDTHLSIDPAFAGSVQAGDTYQVVSVLAGTGTITDDGLGNITGVGTAFLTQLQIGERIFVPDNFTASGIITSITDNTHLTLSQSVNASANTFVYAKGNYYAGLQISGGIVSNGGLIAIGNLSIASALGAIALNGIASNTGSIAIGGTAIGSSSLAMLGGTASGNFDIAIGISANANSGNHNGTIQIGSGTNTGQSSVGLFGSVSGNYSVAMSNAGVSGDNSFGCGNGTAVTQSYSFGMGQVTVSASYSFASGNNLTVSGGAAVAFGTFSTVSGGLGFSAGGSNTVSGASSQAFGSSIIAQGQSQFIFGVGNIAQGTTGSYVPGDYHFIMGNSTDGGSTRSNASTIDGNGIMMLQGITKLTSDFSKTSNTTLAAITGLTATLVAGRNYKFKVVLHITAGVLGGENVDMAGGTASGAAPIIFQVNVLANTTNVYAETSRQTAYNGSSGGVAGDTSYFIIIEGYTGASTGGTFKPQFAQKVSNGTASTVKAGSTMEVWEIK